MKYYNEWAAVDKSEVYGMLLAEERTCLGKDFFIHGASKRWITEKIDQKMWRKDENKKYDGWK